MAALFQAHPLDTKDRCLVVGKKILLLIVIMMTTRTTFTFRLLEEKVGKCFKYCSMVGMIRHGLYTDLRIRTQVDERGYDADAAHSTAMKLLATHFAVDVALFFSPRE
jgi:hypothetical protein